MDIFNVCELEKKKVSHLEFRVSFEFGRALQHRHVTFRPQRNNSYWECSCLCHINAKVKNPKSSVTPEASPNLTLFTGQFLA